MLKHTSRTGRPRVVVRKRKGRSLSRSWPGTPRTLSIVSSEIDYPEVHGGGRMHRPPHPHPITDHRQVNLVFDDTVRISSFIINYLRFRKSKVSS
ncbi:hypothetical protein X777_00522 [Ooceraea biroi]|uniref:Uncharacterized protein n=1 Tax=Ooceraea biroi TaxID=2015173 RepID=A0A026WS06_OOCBI|nr:hypothetical protein X777_00522 [Ooceraea biroi]